MSACHLELSGLYRADEMCSCGFIAREHPKWSRRPIVTYDGPHVLVEARPGSFMVQERPTPQIPDDIRATILRMIDHVTRGDTESPVFHEVHKVREWVSR